MQGSGFMKSFIASKLDYRVRPETRGQSPPDVTNHMLAVSSAAVNSPSLCAGQFPLFVCLCYSDVAGHCIQSVCFPVLAGSSVDPDSRKGPVGDGDEDEDPIGNSG